MLFKPIAAALALSLMAAGANAAVVKYSATLNGPSEVPANTTTGTGKAEATLDTATKVFKYKVTYSGLTGDAVAAHFHGPAGPGANAPPIVMVKIGPSPVTGTATLTDAQVSDLDAGKWYFNVHTKANPGGEIRGQLAKGQ
jgi:hypothetical protein